jgi:hypothetical protein
VKATSEMVPRLAELREWINSSGEWAVGFRKRRSLLLRVVDDAEELIRLRMAVEQFDHEVEQYPGDDGFVQGYRIPVGPMHRLLAAARR